MKFLSAFAFVFLFAAALQADTLDVPSKIDSVTLYQGVAKVTRTFEVDLPAGVPTTLRFSGLPSSVNPDFVQVAATDGAALSFGLSTFDSQFTNADISPTLKTLKAKVRELAAKKDALEQEKKAATDLADSRKALVSSINDGLAKTGSKELYELSKTAYEDAAAVYKDAKQKAVLLDEQIRQTDEDLSVAKHATIDQENREELACGKYAESTASTGGRTKGTLTYYVGNVRWLPSYIVRANTLKGTVDISYMVRIVQTTGEDWNDVALILETSMPGAGAKPVEPSAVLLNRVLYRERTVDEETPIRAMIKASGNLDGSDLSCRGATFAPLPASASNTQGILNEGNITAEFTGFKATVPNRVSVKSDANDKGTTLPLLEKSDIACEFHTETIPLTAETAFLVGKMKNALPLPLLAGPTQVIVDGSTNGTGKIETTLPGDDLTIGLGVNQNVLVERKVVAEKGGNSGIFSGKRVETRSYVNKITNRMPVAQRVVVRDQVPISKDDKIEVKLVAPEKATVDPKTGLFDREVTLQPGASVELPTQYKVSYPSDWQINGGL